MLLGRLLALIWLCTAQVVVASVPNNGFERVDQNDKPRSWTPLDAAVQIAIDKNIKKGGKASARVAVTAPKQFVGMHAQAVSVVEGAAYVVQGFIKFAPGSVRRGFLQVRWLDADLNEMPWAVGMSSWAVGGDAWQEVSGTVIAPAGAQFARLVCVAGDGGEAFEPFDVWFDDVSLAHLSDTVPAHIAIAPMPFSEKREARIDVAVTDSAGASVPDGTVVVMGSNAIDLPQWATTKKGIAAFVLQAGEMPSAGGVVWARVGDLYAQHVLQDVLSGRLVGRVSHAETQRDHLAHVVVQDSLGQVILRQAFEGAFAVSVPPGRWWVTAQSGPTYVSPKWQVVEVVAGDSVAVQLPLRPWVDLKKRGWLAGDLNVRGATGNLYRCVGISDVITSARAAGLDWALLTHFWDTTLRHYRPRDVQLWQDDFFGLWGRLFEAPQRQVWTLGDAAVDAEGVLGGQVLARQDRGVVGHTGVFAPSRQKRAVVLDVLAGPTFDCLDVMSEKANDLEAQHVWFDLLNLGYRITATASSQAVLDGSTRVLPGKFRTYVHLDGEATPARLAQALIEGHSFISSGPLLLFSVFAAGPGSDLPVGRKRRATLQAWSGSGADDALSRIELIRNGEIVESWDLAPPSRTHKLAVTLQDSVDCWYVAKCYGVDDSQIALTNPIYFRSTDFKAPEPVQAVVRGQIQTADGNPIAEAQVVVKNPLGQVILETTARDGLFRLWSPPTSVIEVRAKGYGAMHQRIFEQTQLVDFLDELKQPSMMPDTLFASETVARATQLLTNIDMLFILNKK